MGGVRQAMIPVYYHPEQSRFHPLLDWDERGIVDHPEVPARVQSILAALHPDVLRTPQAIPMEIIQAVHDPGLIQMLQTAESLPEDKPYYITQFPQRPYGDPDPTNIRHAGFFCQDTSTPLDRWTWTSAAWSAASAVSAAQALVAENLSAVYALCRPPGHHASATHFGGFCYLNNAALATHWLKAMGTVAVLDIDYHHGDGTQAIFWRDPQVLYVSLHADPQTDYPYYSGFASEVGDGPGAGTTLNLPLPAGCTGEAFLQCLQQAALTKIRDFAPRFLVVSAGLDTYAQDPLGHFALHREDYQAIGRAIAQWGGPTVVVQEGGYHVDHLGALVAALCSGLEDGAVSAAVGKSTVTNY